MNKTAPLIAITAIAAALLASTAFSLGENNPDNARNRTPGQFAAAGGSGGQGVFGDAPPRANNPTRRQLRIDAPDGGAWVQGYPTEVFTWISAPDQVATGSRSFGMIRYPNITMAHAQIAAAGRMSRAISANNDSMLASMATTRAQSNAAYAARRTASAQRTNSDFDGYIRGTEKMNDPYWGTSEHAYTDKYHWTDGQGSYQHSNEAGFNPNVGARINWTLMKAAQ